MKPVKERKAEERARKRTLGLVRLEWWKKWKDFIFMAIKLKFGDNHENI